MKNSAGVNRAYYDSDQPGRHDYWRYMAAPRLRRARIGEVIRRIDPSSIADLGCGEGLLLEHISRIAPASELLGIDLSAVQIERNRARLSGIEWVAADIGADPFEEDLLGRFDLVISSEVIEHVDDDRAFLASAATIARPGGWLMLTTQSGPVRATERSVGHARHYSATDLAALMTRAGWEVERVWNEGYPFHDLSKWAANLRPDTVMKRFGERSFGAIEHGVSLALRAAFVLNSRRRGAQLFAIGRSRGR